MTTLEVPLNRKQIEDQVASLLHAFGAVPERAEIVHIDFGAPDDHDVVPLKVQIKQEVN